MPSLLTLLRISLVPLIIMGVMVTLGVLFHIRGEEVTEAQMRVESGTTVTVSLPVAS